MNNNILTGWSKVPVEPAMGWTCTYTPEEIIYAAGINPFRVQRFSSSTKLADRYFHYNLCPYTRNCLDYGLKEGKNSLEGIIIANSCDAMRCLYSSWRHHVSKSHFVYLLNVPRNTGQVALDYFSQELHNLVTALEKHFGESIPDQTISEAVDLYNETRDLMSKLYELKTTGKIGLNETGMFNIIQASQSTPRKEFNQQLKTFMETSTSETVPGKTGIKPGIMLVGSILPSLKLLDIIESAGARIISDDLCLGNRYFKGNVSKDEDIIRSIARRYLLKTPCARMKDTRQRIETTVKQVKEQGIDGIIYHTLKFCDNHLYDYPVYHQALDKLGIPILQIEDDGASSNLGQVKTRVEAFVEML